MVGDPQTRRAFFVILVVLSIVLLGAVLWPLSGPIIVASVLAGAIHPWHERLARRFGRRPRLAAGVVTVGVLVAVVFPLSVIGTVVVTEVLDAAVFVRETLEQGGIPALMNELPDGLQGAVERLSKYVPAQGLELSQLARQGEKAAGALASALAATGTLALETVLMLILLFFFLVDGATLVQWLCEIAPMRPGHLRELLLEFRRVSRSVLVSSLATAGVQTIAAFVGFLIAQVPQPIFFAFVTFFFAFIPAIGAGGLTLALALLLLISGHPIAGGFLAAWAIFVVGLADNVVKPLLIRSELHMHGAVVFFSLLGGLAAFGPIGLITGPLTVTFFLALLRTHRRSMGYDRPETPSDHGLVTEPGSRRLASWDTETCSLPAYDAASPERCVAPRS